MCMGPDFPNIWSVSTSQLLNFALTKQGPARVLSNQACRATAHAGATMRQASESRTSALSLPVLGLIIVLVNSTDSA